MPRFYARRTVRHGDGTVTQTASQHARFIPPEPGNQLYRFFRNAVLEDGHARKVIRLSLPFLYSLCGQNEPHPAAIFGDQIRAQLNGLVNLRLCGNVIAQHHTFNRARHLRGQHRFNPRIRLAVSCQHMDEPPPVLASIRHCRQHIPF